MRVLTGKSIGRSLCGLLWPCDANSASHVEKSISALGGFLGMLLMLYASQGVMDNAGAAMVVASMGASAVLLFAVPHSALAQPWAMFGGHLISAFVGVSCHLLLGETLLAGAVAVGLAIGAMYYLHCIHPPGGATALVAVLGGESVTGLGYSFIVTPVLENALLLLLLAMLLSLPFRHRRYPATLSQPADEEVENTARTSISHADLVYALSQLDSFIDVSERDLIRIYTLAVHHTHDPVPCHQNGKVCGEGSDHCLCRRISQQQG